MFNPCAIIPVYNHPDTIGNTLKNVRASQLPVVLVDDGCDSHCRRVLNALAAADVHVHLVQLPENRGKGGAVKAGLQQANQLGFSHALQIDADGQHNPQDIPRFLECANAQPQALISGLPEYDQSVPKLRYYSRYLTHIWIWINTLSLQIQDSMCGFRVYPVAPICALIDSSRIGDRMDFDPELMVKWHWQGGEVLHLATQVRYPEDGISHFRGFEDNWLISKMHAKLFFGMLWRLPKLLSTKLFSPQQQQDVQP